MPGSSEGGSAGDSQVEIRLHSVKCNPGQELLFHSSPISVFFFTTSVILISDFTDFTLDPFCVYEVGIVWRGT